MFCGNSTHRNVVILAKSNLNFQVARSLVSNPHAALIRYHSMSQCAYLQSGVRTPHDAVKVQRDGPDQGQGPCTLTEPSLTPQPPTAMAIQSL